MAFYEGSDKYFKNNMPHFAQPTKQFLAQRYKDVIQHEIEEKQKEIDKEYALKHPYKPNNFPYRKQIPRLIYDTFEPDPTKSQKYDMNDTRPALEVTTNYSKGAVAAKILLTSEEEADKRKKNAIRTGRSYTPIQAEFKIV